MVIRIRQPLSYSRMGKRDNQEDCIYPPEGQASSRNRFFILCDGMGGHNNGEVASNIVCETLGKFFESQPLEKGFLTDDLFKQGLSEAYDALDKQDDGAFRKMGTTLTFIYLHRGGCVAAHLGDSRIYHVRPGKGLAYQSADHTLVNDLLKIGEITPEEAINHPQKNIITRALGSSKHIEADFYRFDLHEGDRVLLCTDGLHGELTDDEIADIIKQKEDLNTICRMLVDAANRNGGHDNITVICVDGKE